MLVGTQQSDSEVVLVVLQQMRRGIEKQNTRDSVAEGHGATMRVRPNSLLHAFLFTGNSGEKSVEY